MGRVTDWQIDIHFPAEAERVLSVLCCFRNSCGGQPAYVVMGTDGSITGTNWPRHEVDQLPLGAQIKNACGSTATLPCLHIVICN